MRAILRAVCTVPLRAVCCCQAYTLLLNLTSIHGRLPRLAARIGAFCRPHTSIQGFRCVPVAHGLVSAPTNDMLLSLVRFAAEGASTMTCAPRFAWSPRQEKTKKKPGRFPDRVKRSKVVPEEKTRGPS